MPIGLIERRQAWCLTWRGRCVVLGTAFVVAVVGLRGCAQFLSLSRPIAAEVLVVEGWLPDYALKGARDEFEHGGYRYLITAGSPLLSGYYNSAAKTSAHLAAAGLIALGVSSNAVVPV